VRDVGVAATKTYAPLLFERDNGKGGKTISAKWVKPIVKNNNEGMPSYPSHNY